MDGSAGGWILGGYQSDFARNLSKPHRDFAALTVEVVEGMRAAVLDGLRRAGLNAAKQVSGGAGDHQVVVSTTRDS